MVPPPSLPKRKDGGTTRQTASSTVVERRKPAPKQSNAASAEGIQPLACQPVNSPSRLSQDQKGRSLGYGKRRAASRPASNVHKPGDIPPAVAALLAVTAIPPLRSSVRSNSSRIIRPSLTLPSRDGSLSADQKYSMLNEQKSPMELLLTPPEELQEQYIIVGEDGSEPLLSSRSLSTDSVPSLDTDTDSVASTNSITSPSPARNAKAERRPRAISPFATEVCNDDHPLLVVSEIDLNVKSPISANHKVPFFRQRPSLKSNLTASLRVLRSAARSFSNFAAPAVHIDTQSILNITPQFTDERRPLPTCETPTPALRRYLNPSTNPLRDSIYDFRGFSKMAKSEKCRSSVQLKTYRDSSEPSRRSTASPILSERADSRPEDDPFGEAACATGPLARQREARENSDFMRVIVLEMNMRRNGKLADHVQGKARFVLPPRRLGRKMETIGADGIPHRWVALLP